MRRDPVDEPAVVRDEDDRPFELEERLLQPFARVEVEVVRRLVEQEQIRAAEDDAGEGEAPLLASREGPHLLLHRVAPEVEKGEEVPCLAVEEARVEVANDVEDCPGRREVSHLLVVVADEDSRSRHGAPRDRYQDAGHRLQERRLPAAVRSPQGDPLSAPQEERDGREERPGLGVARDESLQLEDPVARSPRLLESEEDVVRVFPRRLEPLQLRQHLPSGLGLPRLLPGDVPPDEVLGPLDELPLLLGRLRPDAVALGLQLPVGVVVARVLLQDAVGDLDDPVGDGVEELPVVRDDERRLRGRVLPLDEPGFEELETGHVEVVRRLVEKEDRRVTEKEARDLRPVLLSPRELADGPVPRLPRQADAEEDALHPRVGLVATVSLETLAQGVVLGKERLDHLGGPGGGRRGDGLLEAAHLGLEPAEPLLRPGDELAERLFPLRLDGLLERGEGRPTCPQDTPRVGLDEPLDDPKECRLPRAVTADEAGHPPRVVLPRGARQDGLRSKDLVDPLEPVEHARRITSAVPPAGLAPTPPRFRRRRGCALPPWPCRAARRPPSGGRLRPGRRPGTKRRRR